MGTILSLEIIKEFKELIDFVCLFCFLLPYTLLWNNRLRHQLLSILPFFFFFPKTMNHHMKRNKKSRNQLRTSALKCTYFLKELRDLTEREELHVLVANTLAYLCLVK